MQVSGLSESGSDGRGAHSDAELLVAAGRDPRVFGELFERHAGHVFRWARGAGLGEADAFELVSEVFARAWVFRGRFRDPGDGSAAPWLFGIARNLVASQRRSGRIETVARKRLRVPVAQADAIEAAEARVDASARRAQLNQALGALPESQREAVQLRVVDGLEYSDIALRLSCTETTARKWVSLGLRSLRTRMEASR